MRKWILKLQRWVKKRHITIAGIPAIIKGGSFWKILALVAVEDQIVLRIGGTNWEYLWKISLVVALAFIIAYMHKRGKI